MGFCKNCGHKMQSIKPYCSKCGFQVGKASIQDDSQTTTRSAQRTQQTPANHMKFLIFGLIIGAAAIMLVVHFFILEDNTAQPASPVDQKVDKSGGGTKPKEDTENGTDGANEPTNDTDFERYMTNLQNYEIVDGNTSYELGEWSIKRVGDTITITAEDIPSDSLEGIFMMYDNDNLEPLKEWAKKIYQVGAAISSTYNQAVTITVGNMCTNVYPVTLPNSELMDRSGSCGYSIPVLEGTSKEDLTLVVTENVYSKGPVLSNEYIFADSDSRELEMEELYDLTKEELRLARNELYARHGYVFESEDLQDYFSNKSWYTPDPYYDGSLSDIEKRNAELIMEREESFQ